MKKVISLMLFLSLGLGILVAALPVYAGGASDMPKAPIGLQYTVDEIGSGLADGVVTVTLPAGHNAEDIYLFWGDDNGKLPGYTAFSPFKVSGNVVTHRIRGEVVVPQGATRLLAYTYSDANGMSESYASCALPADSAMTDDMLGTLLFEFQAVSDIHLTKSYSPRLHHSDHMRAMLADIAKISPNSIGIFNNGDTANNGYDADYQEFLDILGEFENAPTVYSGIGNHELFRHGTPPKGENFSEMKEVFWNYLGTSVPQDASFSGGSRFSSLSYSFVRSGFKFIFLGTDVLDQNNLTLSNATLEWLESELESAGKGQPTFIIMHQPMSGTLAGSFKDGYGVTANTTTALKELLSKYPEVIMFNGHSHRDLNQYGIHYSRDEKLPNIFGTSSVGYLARAYDSSATETYKGSEGYYVYVYEDKVVVRGRDFLKGEWVASAQFIVDLSEEGLEKEPAPEVEAPLYGSTAEVYAVDRQIGGTVTCNLPVNNNASVIALFFSSADTGIIGSDPFATYEVDCKDNYFTCNIPFAGVTVPYTADYILVYSYSYTLGWSDDCDVIALETSQKENVSSSGAIKTDKCFYRLGEPIYITATKGNEKDWIGMQLSSVNSGTKLWYDLGVSGLNKAFDVTKKVNFTGNEGDDYKFAKLEAGKYEIAWVSETSNNFQTGKEKEDTVEITVVDMSETLSLGVPVGDGITDPNLSLLNTVLTDVSNLKQSDYTEESWNTLYNAVASAIIVRDDAEHTQEEIDSAYESVLEALSALVKVSGNSNSTQDTSNDTTDSSNSTTDNVDDSSNDSGCGSVILCLPFCTLLACVPFVIKKKRF